MELHAQSDPTAQLVELNGQDQLFGVEDHLDGLCYLWVEAPQLFLRNRNCTSKSVSKRIT